MRRISLFLTGTISSVRRIRWATLIKVTKLSSSCKTLVATPVFIVDKPGIAPVQETPDIAGNGAVSGIIEWDVPPRPVTAGNEYQDVYYYQAGDYEDPVGKIVVVDGDFRLTNGDGIDYTIDRAKTCN